MHLINPLVAGIRGAEIGSVELLERGTATHAVYYKDFPASQQYSAQPIPLDSFGSVTLYVEELVDVLVHDANGVLVRQFVAGDYAAAVEVISQSFTGTNYRDGTIGPFKPTNLASVLDLWKTNAGAIDWKVLVGGLPVTIGDALSSFAAIYFNVKSYGALGNGIADDGAAITAAITAAAVAGGTVFFPPGVYRHTGTIVVPVNVCLLGSGAPASKIAIDNASVFNMSFTGSESGGMRTVRSLWLGSVNSLANQAMALVSGTGARVVFEDCLFGNDTNTIGTLVICGNTTLDSLVVFNRCSFFQVAAQTLAQTFDGRVTFRDCDFKGVFTGSHSGPWIAAGSGTLIEGCRFDASALTAGSFAYIGYGTPTVFAGAKFVNNTFKKGPAVLAAFRVTGPSVGAAIFESGNSFGDIATGALPGYREDAGDGTIIHGTDVGPRLHGSRENRCFGTPDPNGPFLADAKNYGVIMIDRSIAGAQVISATLGQLGDRLQILITNHTGGSLNITFGAQFTMSTTALVLLPINGKGLYQFMFLPANTGSTIGTWVMLGVSVDN
jgi:hypothetical protein